MVSDGNRMFPLNPQPSIATASKLEDVAMFLLGEKSLEGRWFGETYVGIAPYWWRRHLREALQASQPLSNSIPPEHPEISDEDITAAEKEVRAEMEKVMQAALLRSTEHQYDIGTGSDELVAALEETSADLCNLQCRRPASDHPDDHTPGCRRAKAALNAIPTPDRVEVLERALTKCRDKFREYEEVHMTKLKPAFGVSSATAAKRSEENALARSKAERNREMANMCDAALNPKESGR